MHFTDDREKIGRIGRIDSTVDFLFLVNQP